MKALTAATLRGNWATLLLPIRPDDSIDFELLGAEIDTLIATRVDGIYSNGSAGEFYAQTDAEFERVQQTLAERCEPAGVPFQIGATHMSPHLARERLRRTKSLRPSAFQVILPDWFVPSWAEIERFLEGMIATADGIPLVLYNPPHAKRRLVPDEWKTIAQRFPQVVGMKVPGGDAAWFNAMRPVFETMAVFIPGHRLASGMQQGAHGAYSNVSCLSSVGAQRWSDLCRRDLPAGIAMEEKIQRFWLGQIAPLITRDQLPDMAADKAAAVAGAWLPGLHQRLRWPYRCAQDDRVAEIAREARAQLPEFFG